jgi:hypothetical protein
MEWGSAAEWGATATNVAIACIAFWQLGGIRNQVKAAHEQVQIANKQALDARAEAKVERTLAACSRYESDAVIERCVRRLRCAHDEGIQGVELRKFQHEIIMVLNYLDSLAIGFSQGLYDEKLAKDHMSAIVKMYRERFLDKEQLLKSLDIDPGNYHCIINLAKKWSAKPPAYRASERLMADTE